MAARRTATKYAVSQSEKILPPEGLHNARVSRFLELGTQDTDWGEKFKCQISYTLVDETAVFNEEDGEQNFVLHRTYNKSLGSGSDMGKAVRAILGKDYVNDAEEIEMDEILDQPCKVMVEYSDDEEYANIIKVFPWKKSDGKCAKLPDDPMSCYLDENFDQSVFDTLPEWIQETMATSPEGEELIEEGLMEWEDPKPKSKKKGKGAKAKSSKRKDDDDDEDEEDEKPKRRGSRKAKDEEEEEEDEDDDDKPKRRRSSKRDDSEDDEDEKPKRRSKRSDDTDESEEDEEDEKPKRRGKQTTRSTRKKR